MPDTQHTPGPWEVNTVPTQIGHAHRIDPIRACLYVDYRDKAGVDEKMRTAKANARLIAAAPEMLAALKAINEAIPNSSDPGEMVLFTAGLQNEARAAIEKAT